VGYGVGCSLLNPVLQGVCTGPAHISIYQLCTARCTPRLSTLAKLICTIRFLSSGVHSVDASPPPICAALGWMLLDFCCLPANPPRRCSPNLILPLPPSALSHSLPLFLCSPSVLPAREGWHCAAGGGCLRTCAVPPFARPSDSPLPLRAGLPNPNLFCFRPWTFVAAATASFPDADRCQNSSSPMSLPSIHHGYTFTFPSAAYLSPHPLDFSAAQRSRRPPPPAAAILRGSPWPQRQRRVGGDGQSGPTRLRAGPSP